MQGFFAELGKHMVFMDTGTSSHQSHQGVASSSQEVSTEGSLLPCGFQTTSSAGDNVVCVLNLVFYVLFWHKDLGAFGSYQIHFQWCSSLFGLKWPQQHGNNRCKLDNTKLCLIVDRVVCRIGNMFVYFPPRHPTRPAWCGLRPCVLSKEEMGGWLVRMKGV